MQRAARAPVGALAWALVVATGAGLPARAQAPAAPEVRALDLRETVERIPVSVTDLTGREATRNIPLTVYRPDGPGPHPVAIVSHGRAAGA
jgi:hypothetical protein